MSSRTASLTRGSTRTPAAAVGRTGLTVARRALAGVTSFVARRPAAVLVVAVLGGGASLICWNALMTQSGRHPAPLFPPPKPVAAVIAAPPVEPPRRPTVTTTASVGPAPAVRAEPASAQGRQAAAETVSRTPGADPIGALLKSDTPATKAEPKSTSAASSRSAEPKPAPAASSRLVSAQKALAKLGYGPIGTDGVMGTTTKRAIERFEKDKGLPVTGALGTRTSKKLASVSGMQLD